MDLLLLNSSDRLLFILNLFFLFYKTTCLYEEVNCIETFLFVSVPFSGLPWFNQFVSTYCHVTQGSHGKERHCRWYFHLHKCPSVNSVLYYFHDDEHKSDTTI
jgi:hypothetical protein